MSSFYEGSGLPDDQGLDPDEMTPAQRLLDEQGPVDKPVGYEADRWGVAVPNDERPGCFRVVRYATHEDAEVAAWHRGAVVHPDYKRGPSGGLVSSIIWQHRLAGKWPTDWYFPATGWKVPR